MDNENLHPVEARRRGPSPPAYAHVALLWWLGGLGIVLGLVLSRTAVDSLDNPWPAILAPPASTLGVVSVVAAVLLSGIREVVRARPSGEDDGVAPPAPHSGG